MNRAAKIIMVQGTTSGAGKSTITIGLCRIFSDEGYKVAPFKAQNMSSNFFTTARGSKMALVQAIQAVAARKEPDPEMNPILLKPIGQYKSAVFLNGRFYSEMYAKEYYEKFVKQHGFSMALKALDNMRSENDIIVIEGAGSPSEINIAKYDIANMLLAQEARAPVLIVADIERGGCFASIVGTMQLLKSTHRERVKGFLINKFRGDITLLAPAIKKVQKMTKRRILGVIPKIEFNLPEEDSLIGNRVGKVEIPQESWNWQIDIVAKSIKENIDMERISKVVGL
ncbi:MAG: cobyric acid synthase [Thermoproteota archaeon]|nr:cobyric acid synthase [Thermoproteota archaeon]